MKTAPVKFSVTQVNCRHCGVEIPIELSPGLSVEEMLAECERQAEAKHPCSAKDTMREPEEPAAP